ncbi:MAG: YqaJ viral recombinase family protein [Bacteroidales bacterium]|nr:YqaJ viral recombinase family protein [Bacteroidales bacterium]
MFHDIEQNSDQWFSLRLGRITSSKFDVMNMKPSTKGYQNYIRKIAYERLTGESFPEKFNGNEFTEAGHEREQVGKDTYEQRTFQKVHPGGFFEVDDWVGGSPDSLVSNDGLLEVKNVITGNQLMELVNYNFKPSREQSYQCYGQMYVSGRQWVDLMHIHIMESGRQIVNVQRIHRDEEIMSEIEENLEVLKKAIKEEMRKLEAYL